MTASAQGPAHALPPAWAGQDIWRVLDTRFDQGLRFLATWQTWRLEDRRPRLLHYVALSAQPLAASELLQAAETFPELHHLAQELAAQCWGLLPGFHRLTLAHGQVLLTLCVGEAPALLREQQFAADAIVLDTSADEAAWDRWACKALAQCSRRGTQLTVTHPSAALQDRLAQSGFELTGRHGQFNPRWELKTTRTPQRPRAARPGRCAVIGAGLAGASVAAALARRGWQVEVLDSAPAPAAGASGLPVGLVVPHVSADDSPRSRLSRAGVRLMLQELRRLLVQGQDWDLSGVLEHRVDGTPGLPRDWAAAGRDWAHPVSLTGAWTQGMKPGVPSLWHAQAAWVKPAQLVRAWLSQPGVAFHGLNHVAGLRHEDEEWLLLDDAGNTLTRASHVVLANACNLTQLLSGLQASLPVLRPRVAQLPALHGMRGLLSWGLQQAGHAADLPTFPVNGLGSLIPSIPSAQGPAWYAGATYEAVTQSALPGAAHHQINFDKLTTLLPTAAQALATAFTTGQVQAWGNTRCVSSDRLPLVGALDAGEMPSLWLSAALGSRGLSFSMLCAELLAAQLGAEPWPVEASLARFLHARRRPPSGAEDTQAV